MAHVDYYRKAFDIIKHPATIDKPGIPNRAYTCMCAYKLFTNYVYKNLKALVETDIKGNKFDLRKKVS